MRQLKKLELFLTDAMISNFKKLPGNEDMPTEKASLLMQVAIGLFCPSIDAHTVQANEMLAENYELGYADGSKVSANNLHFHAPEGSSLAAEGSSVMIRPGDAADWKPIEADDSKRSQTMERYARMESRLFRLSSRMIGNDKSNVVESLQQILRDEDPTWPI